jgi:hypothetical protein
MWEISTNMFLTIEEGEMGFTQKHLKYNYTGPHKAEDNNVILLSPKNYK